MIEQESLVVIFSLKKFHHYLLGYKAKIVIDHKVFNLLGQQVQSKWLTCLMAVINGGILH
jgi:hypothetical protein